MKCLLFNSDEIKFIQGEKSDRPLGIQSFEEECDNILYKQVCVAFVCVVEGDTTQDVEHTAKHLQEYSEMIEKKILLVPFVHLDSCPAEDEESRPLLLLLKNICKQRSILKGCSSYGYHKSFIARWVTLSHKGSVAFRDSRFKKRKK